MNPDRLVRHFHNRGSAGAHLRPFSQHEPSVQAFLQAAVVLGEDEIPVIACFHNVHEWSMLTTKRLIVHDSDVEKAMQWLEIVDSTPHIRPETGQPLTKNQLDELDVTTSTGSTIRVKLEAGAPLSGFWNLLKLIARTSEKERPPRR